MYRTVHNFSIQRSFAFDLSDGINNNLMTESQVQNDAFHPPVDILSRPDLVHSLYADVLDDEIMELMATDIKLRNMDDIDIGMTNRNKIDFFRGKRAATAPNSPGPYCKKNKKHIWSSLSAAPTRKNSIHFETLESVSVAELYRKDECYVNEQPVNDNAYILSQIFHDVLPCRVNTTADSTKVEEFTSPNVILSRDQVTSVRSSEEAPVANSFVNIFNRCRLERDASLESTNVDSLADEKRQGQDMLDGNQYELLCAERVSQMTKTYNDIEAVTRLLEEKERDLELAARIGQTLLSKNKELSTRTDALEDQLSQANDRINQLRHDLGMKDELLRFYNEDLELQHGADVTPNEKPTHGLNVDFLERKVQSLEDENLNLKLESAQLKLATDSLEEKEKRLVEDCIQQLAEVNQQVESLAEELQHKSEENAHHKEEITTFLSQIAELQKKVRKLTLENMELHEKLSASQESQRKLTKELGGMQDKYDELLEMLEETQDELRLMKGKHKVKANAQHHHSAYVIPTDSLASELETSLQQELSQSSRRAQSWKVFETARAAKRAAAKAAEKEAMSTTRMSLLNVPQNHVESDSQNQSTYPSDVESFVSDGYSADLDSLYGSNPELGRPGIPGSNDLESALKRLAMRKANELNERDFFEEEEKRMKRSDKDVVQSGATSPLGTKSPGSAMSYNSAYSGPWNNSSGPGHSYKMSDKLQIVKPLEGSMTLRHWQHLATPHLGGIFEERDGIQMRGEKKLELVEEVYSLSDFEEDDDPSVHTRREQDHNLIYTFTNSTVRNPEPYRGLGTLSSMNVSSSSITIEESPAGTSTPKAEPINLQSVGNTQNTYTMSLGLAALLHGRESSKEDKHTVFRVSAPKSSSTNLTNTQTSSPAPSTQSATSPADLNQRVLSARSAGGLAVVSSSLPKSYSKNVPGSRSFDKSMDHTEDPGHLLFDDANTKAPSLFTPGMTGRGFLEQLKSKGYSLYGLWGGKSKEEAASTSDSNIDTVDGSKTGSGEDSSKVSAKSVFVNGSGGVLGALTNFRRNGIL